jgi:serine/threonine protein kinase
MRLSTSISADYDPEIPLVALYEVCEVRQIVLVESDDHVYVLDEVLQSNPKASVYRAHPEDDPDIQVVVKIESAETAWHEIAVTDALPDSPHLIHRMDQSPGGGARAAMDDNTMHCVHFVVYPFAQGSDLFDALASRNWDEPMPFTWSVLEQTLEGLARLHGVGIIHSDIKLEDLLFNGDFEEPAISVADYDMSSPIGAPSRGGTPGYAPPAVFKPDYEADPGRDIFSLGVSVFVMLARALPVFFAGEIAN